MLTGIHHVALICGDYARSKAFYTELLGLEIIAETYREARDSWKLVAGKNLETGLNFFSSL